MLTLSLHCISFTSFNDNEGVGRVQPHWHQVCAFAQDKGGKSGCEWVKVLGHPAVWICSLSPHLCNPLHSLLKWVCVFWPPSSDFWEYREQLEYVGNYTFGKLWPEPDGSQIPWLWMPWIVQSGWLHCWKSTKWLSTGGSLSPTLIAINMKKAEVAAQFHSGHSSFGALFG